MPLRVTHCPDNQTSVERRRNEHFTIASRGCTFEPKDACGIFEGESKAFVLVFGPPLSYGKVATQNANA